MKRNLLWVGMLGLALGLATHRMVTAADKKTDFEAEQKQMEKEDAEQQAERDKGIKGKYQVLFVGTVHLLRQPDEEISPDVIGYFVTDLKDPKPGRCYQLRLMRDSEAVKAMLKSLDRKHAKLTGKLRCIGENGDAKYLIVDSVLNEGPTPRVPERRSASGL